MIRTTLAIGFLVGGLTAGCPASEANVSDGGRRDLPRVDGGRVEPPRVDGGRASADEDACVSCGTCSNAADGRCEPGCPDDPDCTACVPGCAGRECGGDGCGGSCGSCAADERCASGMCDSSCSPDCGGRACGADGCGGSCGTCDAPSTCNSAGECVSECVPECTGRVCGGDGCGGECGRSCPAGRACNATGTGCGCDSFATVTYVIDGSSIDWTTTNVVAVNANHIALDGSRSDGRGVSLTAANPTQELEFYGCEPRLEVRRNYGLRGGIGCMFMDTVTSTNVYVPGAMLSGRTCTAGAL